MSFHHHHFLLLLLSISNISLSSTLNPSKPITCKSPSPIPTCNSFLYTQSQNLSLSTISSLYSSNASLARNITRPDGAADYLLQVPCTCIAAPNATALFYRTNYRVVAGDTRDHIISNVFSGLAWNVDARLLARQLVAVYLPCGCLSGGEATVVSYAVEMGDTVLKISGMLSADADEMIKMNSQLVANPDFMDLGWLLFVPMGTARRRAGGGEAC